MGEVKRVSYRAVHTITSWRKVKGHDSLQNALVGRDDGAPGLFSYRVRIDYGKHGKPLYAVIWEDGAAIGYVVKPQAGNAIGTVHVEVPIDIILAYDAQGGASISELERHFASETRTHEALSDANASDQVTPIHSATLPVIAEEGAASLETHMARERNPTLVEAKKAAVLQATGKLACEACHFDFATTYRDIGLGFCEVHHLRPIGARAEAENTTLNDLAILCSNCHSMIHRTNPMWPVSKLAIHIGEHRP
jgi:5-methylcytosine-specific restriction protein A